MPELPEIETVRRDLEESVLQARIVKVEARDPLVIMPPVARKLRKVLPGEVIESLDRCGKVLIVNLSGGWSVLQRFGMTGQMWPLENGEALPPHVRMVWHLEGGRRLIYRDARRFGETRLVRTEELGQVLTEDCGLGPDALAEERTAEELAEMLKAHGVALKNFLMDQTHLAGIGNIYASEIMHRCRLHPEKPADTLSPRQSCELLRETRKVLKEAVAAQGTTISDYRTGENKSGGYQLFLRVYGREGERCRRRGCPGTIRRIVQAQRSSFFCPVCQCPESGDEASAGGMRKK